jgi:putative ABC transport system permease protein
MPAIYLSTQQEPPAIVGMAVRSPLEPDAVARRIEPVAREIAGATIVETMTLDDQIDRVIQPLRWFGLLFGVIGAAAVALALHGVHAAVRASVRVRRRELAIRAAVGARPAHLLAMILRQTATPIAIGLALGAVATWTAGRVLQMRIGDLVPLDIETAGILAAALTVAAIAGAVGPAARASMAPPVRVLRDT